MADFDRVTQWRDLCEHYRRLTDEELIALAQQKTALTDLAQQALTSEISYRKLTVPPAPLKQAPPPPPPDDGDPYAEDRELVEIAMVWSLRDARQLQSLFDAAGIPFFMGAEKATDADRVTSSFPAGVSVGVMTIGVPWAQRAMADYSPQDDREPPPLPEDFFVSVHCPKCNSQEVIFERLKLGEDADPAQSRRFLPGIHEWTCCTCGQEWEDDGIVREK